MGVTLPHRVVCSNCRQAFSVELARSVNASRFPAARQSILAGTMHRVSCVHCGARATVEKGFTYVDLERNTVISVRPRKERHTWDEASRHFEAQLRLVPTRALKAGEGLTRVVFGMGELREKLVAQDAGLDDRDVEMLKALVVNDHPFLLQIPRLRLHLVAVTSRELEFRAGFDHDLRVFKATIPRALAAPLMGDGGVLRRWAEDAHREQSLYALAADRWVSIDRWSPRNWALSRLQDYARTIRAGGMVDVKEPHFKQMLEQLPRGNDLPGWAKQDLRVLYGFAKTHGHQALEDTLFEVRFGKGLDDDWAFNNDPDDIATLWDLLKDLPDTNVEGNVRLNQVQLETGMSWYDPGSGDIFIAEEVLPHREDFQDVVRHEVGHAVHEGLATTIDSWLTQRFGWKRFDESPAGIDAWINEMGGWGPLNETERAQVREILQQVRRVQEWGPGPAPNPPSGHPWWRPDLGPRLAYERTGSSWFYNHPNWYRVCGKAFFVNFWYGTFVVVDEATLELIARMPSSYAAMSHFEFFAELYALFYDLDDPLRRNIPADVTSWLQNNVGSDEGDQPAPAADVPVFQGDDIIRPTSIAAAVTPGHFAGRHGYDPEFLASAIQLPTFDEAIADDVLELREMPGTRSPWLHYEHFSLAMSVSRRFALVTAANVDSKLRRTDRSGIVRPSGFAIDPRIGEDQQVGGREADDLYGDEPYNFDQGHLVRREDPIWGPDLETARRANRDTHFFTNCAPQHELFNQDEQGWRAVEEYVLKQLLVEHGRVSVFTGPIFFGDDPAYGVIRVPVDYWKIIVTAPPGGLVAVAFRFTQRHLLEQPVTDFEANWLERIKCRQKTIRSIEDACGLRLGTLNEHDPLGRRVGPDDDTDVEVPIRVVQEIVLSPAG